MDNNHRGPTAVQGAEPSAEAAGDWRIQLPPNARERIVNKIIEILKKNHPFTGEGGLKELNNIAVRLEEKIYTCSTSQDEYLRKLSLKMLTMESNQSPNTVADS